MSERSAGNVTFLWAQYLDGVRKFRALQFAQTNLFWNVGKIEISRFVSIGACM